ncbi:unnamed protein product [Ectocarpus sp. 12 AP-2014]
MNMSSGRRTGWGCAWAVAASLCVKTGAFFSSPPHSSRGRWGRATTELNGVREWKQGQPGDLREIGLLPFPVDDVMCPGETKALHLYEARFLSLFENAIKNHGGCVGGAIFVDDGVLVRVGQLCDIVAWEREEVGVSVALRCIGRCEIGDVTNVDPYIRANVREVRDVVGLDEPDEEGEDNGVVSSDVFSLHRQCVELEGKMATAAGGNVGWEDEGGRGPSPSRGRVVDDDDGDDDELFDDDDVTGSAEEFEGAGSADGAEVDDLMERFQRGGGELDLSQLGGGSSNGDYDRRTSVSIAGAAEDIVAGWQAEDDEDEEEEEDDEEKEEGGKAKGLGDLLWGHEAYESDGFDSSLEDQVEAMYDCLKAHLTVSLEENRGGADAAAFGATDKKTGGDRPWGAASGPKTIADVVAAAAAAAGSSGGEMSSSEEGDGEGQYLWGCTSPQEEREQLVSFASLGCFDPSARLQSLMLMSTGERLRMARDALAERLKDNPLDASAWRFSGQASSSGM